MIADAWAYLRAQRRYVAGAGALLAIVTSVWWLPAALRPLDFFRVRHVSVRGLRYLDARDVVRRMQIDTSFSIWNDLTAIERRLTTHPQVRAARAGRRPPSTIVITLVEAVPIALVPTAGGMRAVAEDATMLPLDPARVAVDLPILSRSDTTLLRLLADVRSLDPAIFARISIVERTGRDDAVVFLSSLPVRVRPGVAAERFAELRAVEEDLARRGVRVTELDLRFRDQIIARVQ
ncbi:MAG: cell division protein FtsQ/DivIB [Gemmatimonadaceae bacterium]